jgi:hypothetical protein
MAQWILADGRDPVNSKERRRLYDRNSQGKLPGPVAGQNTPKAPDFAGKNPHVPVDVASVLKTVQRPRRALVTAGMPYANGPLHLGHLAGAHLPADIYSRWMGMLIGRENVLFVNGTDDHGSTSEVSAAAAGIPIREFIDGATPSASMSTPAPHSPRRFRSKSSCATSS